MTTPEVRIEFELTWEDYRSAAMAYFVAERRAGAARRLSWRTWVRIGMFSAAMVMFCSYAATNTDLAGMLRAPTEGFIRFLAYVLPWFVATTVLFGPHVQMRKGR